MLLYHVILKICAFQGSSDNHSPLLSPAARGIERERERQGRRR